MTVENILNNNKIPNIHLYLHSTQNYILQMFSNETNINRLGIQFNKQEEENFALFNYVNELSSEVEILNDGVRLLEESIGMCFFFNFEKNIFRNCVYEDKIIFIIF